MFEQLGGGSGKILGFKINDGVTGEDVRKMSRILADAIAEWWKILILIDIEGFRHMEIEALIEKFKFAKDHSRDIERMAVLSDRVWIKSLVKVGGLLAHTETKHFYRSEIEAAWKWLES
jgi:hypothetical protein